MRLSQLLVRTQREPPSDAESPGHTLLVRAGYVRRLSAGIYSLLPLGTRVLANIEAVIREEQDLAGMQEVVMPVLSPYEIWEESGRSKIFGSDALPAMITENRGGTFVLGPTHEEVVTRLVSGEVESYRQLPVTVYQIQSKFRDEARPRSGLMRGREFTMSDSYSFDASKELMVLSYQRAYDAYLKIFDRLGIAVTPVEAVSGAIGGDVNHEFMAPSLVGEDHFASCSHCGLAANIEAATRRVDDALVDPSQITAPAPSDVATPDAGSIDAVAALLDVSAPHIMKSIACIDDRNEVVIIVLEGHREARIPHGWRMFDEADFVTHPTLVRGFIGPVSLDGVRVIADLALATSAHSFVTGANRVDTHLMNVVVGRDFVPESYASYVVVESGDLCSNCGNTMELQRSVEAAHTFQLGLHYSSKMKNATFIGEDGTEQPFWMGCYGIGVTRLLAVLAEANHDELGLIWPEVVAPYDVTLLALGAARNERVAAVADEAYVALRGAGVNVLYDDRDVSPGVKFADADLLGVPWRIMVGSKGLERSIVEIRSRATGEIREISLDTLLAGQLS
jgi:prolyl-tRNA synthetase